MKNKNKTPYILGLDVGSNSIGWAVVDCEIENGNHKGIYAGYNPVSLRALNSRIFLEMVEAKTQAPKNQKRRTARGARTRRSYYKQRRKKLVNILMEKGLLPNDYWQNPEKILNKIDLEYGERKVGKRWSKTWSVAEKAHCSPYAMRNFALEEKLEPFEFGRLLLHLQRRRGYFSNRGAKYIELIKYLLLGSPEDDPASMGTDEKKETGEVLKAISKLSKELGERTLGQFIWQESQKNRKPPQRITLFEFEEPRTHKGEISIKNLQFRAKREMYESEFDAIWEKQSAFHGISEQEARTIREKIFHQRPLQLQKNTVGNCNIYPKKKRSALIRLEFQEFRTLQVINNLKVNGNPLESDQRQRLMSSTNNPTELNSSGRIPLKKVAKILGVGHQRLNYESSDDEAGNTGLIGNKTAQAISKSIGISEWQKLDQSKQTKLVEDLHTIHNKKDLYKRLVEHWGFAPYREGSNTEAGALGLTMNEKLEDGYAKHSLKAINQLLPYLRDGLDYYKAVDKIGHRESITKSNKETEDDYMLRVEDVPNIANPIVQKALHEMRRVVNSIVKRYGKPAIIRMEMAREMKSSKKHRSQIASQQDKNRKENEEAEKEILKHSSDNANIDLEKLRNDVSRVSRSDRSKYKMWKYEQGEKCPYCQQPIGFSQLFSGDAEIEHILPYSGFRQNYMNTLVSCRTCNQIKGKRTPYETWGSDPDRWERIEQFAEKRYVGSLYGKQRNIRKKNHSPETADDFVERQLNDTRYIATASKKMLEKYGIRIDVNTGMATSELRHKFGLNNILPREPDTGVYIPTGDKVDTDTGEILQFSADKAKKIRQDHRHHAVDAFVVAITDGAMVKAMVEIHKKEQDNKNPSREKTKEDFRARRLVLPESWEESEELHSVLKGKLNTAVVSHMVKRKVWGALHEETLYGKSCFEKTLNIEGMTQSTLKQVQRVTEADTDDTDWIANEELRSILYEWSIEMQKRKQTDRVLPQWKGKELKLFGYQSPSMTVRRKLTDKLELLSKLGKEWNPGTGDWIADKSIHDALFKWLEKYNLVGKKPKEIKKVLSETPPCVINKKGEPSTPIKNLRIARLMTDSYIKIANSYVKPGSNHHFVLYHNGKEDKERKRQIKMVTMLEAAKRASSKKLVIDRNPPLEWNGEWHYELDLCVNDMVRCEDSSIFENGNFTSEHRDTPYFRVQNMSSTKNTTINLSLRHHSVSGTDSNWGLWNIRSLENIKCKKVQVGNLGLLANDS